MIDRIIKEEVDKYVRSKNMLREYKNPKDSETVRVCADMLQTMYDRIISSGLSKREATVEEIEIIIKRLKRLEQIMSM